MFLITFYFAHNKNIFFFTNSKYMPGLPKKVHIRANPPTCNCPPYFAEGDKNFGFFPCKKPFFFYRKKGKRANCPPYLRKKCSEGGGAVRWVCPDYLLALHILTEFESIARRLLGGRATRQSRTFYCLFIVFINFIAPP